MKQLSLILFFMCISASSIASDASAQKEKSATDTYTELMTKDDSTLPKWKEFITKNPHAIKANNVNVPDSYIRNTALHYRAYEQLQFKPTIYDLVEMKGDVNAQNLAGDTPLFNAVNTNNIHVVQQLIACNADPGIQNTHGETVIPWALGCGRINRIGDSVAYLTYVEEQTNAHKELPADRYVQFMACFPKGIEPYTWRWYFSQDPKVLTGQNINATDNAGQTALHLRMTAPAEEKPRIKSLLALKANIDAQDNKGDTALHKAAQREKLDLGIIQALVDAHADVSLKNREGKKAVDLLSKETPEHTAMKLYLQLTAQQQAQATRTQQPSKSTKKETTSAKQKSETKQDK